MLAHTILTFHAQVASEGRKIIMSKSDDTISRQAAIDAMAELQGKASTKAELKGISKAWKRIKQLPSAQPERKKGKWIEEDDGWDGVFWRCSECNEPFYLVDGTPVDNGLRYCPNCGKGMKIKETDCDYERVYERVVDQLECDMSCESTFNQDDVLVNRPIEPYRGD
jgi:hypothetical protein